MQSILIAGGDMRQIELSNMLKQKGFDVYIKGFEKLNYLEKETENPDYVFLPIPYRTKDGYIKASYTDNKMMLVDIVHKYPKSVYLLGRCDDAAKTLFKQDIRYIDLLKNEAFLVQNALLTAEAAICACLKQSDTALCDTTCVVIGFGRIGKFLCKLLKAFAAEVIATARKDSDLALISAEHIQAVHTQDAKYVLSEADVIFNTVPFHVLGETELNSIKIGAKVIELASPPYGMDLELAKKMGVDVQIESGLPGKYFPVSAANAILHVFEREEL